MSKRIEQINALLQQIIAEILIENIEFEPGVLATITRVDTAADLGHAKIFVSVLPIAKKKEAFNKIKKSIFEIQKIVFLNNLPKRSLSPEYRHPDFYGRPKESFSLCPSGL